MLKKTKNHINKLPETPGVYFLKNAKGTTFYIGKAINIKKRVKNHFPPSPRLRKGKQRPSCWDKNFIDQVSKIGYVKTGSEIDALLLESQLIKKHRPKYNILLRDDKQYFYVEFTREKLPRLIITHQPNVTRNGGVTFSGPFTDGKSLKTVLRYLRKTFPYYMGPHRKLPCSYCHIDLCPGPPPKEALGEPRSSKMSGNRFATEYKKNIARIKAILRGQKPRAITSLKKEMAQLAREQNFERAAKIRDQIMALENIFAHKPQALASSKVIRPRSPFRKAVTYNGLPSTIRASLPYNAKLNFDFEFSSLEAYDISNIQGKEAVASMIRFDNGKPNKSLYRKFKIHLPEKPNDVAMIKEVVRRRLAHTEWPYPEFMLIDGGRAQLNAALSQFSIFKSQFSMNGQMTKVSIAALAKKHNELYMPNCKKPIPLNSLSKEVKYILMYARDEAHRFAVSYHRKLHRKKILDI